MPNTDPCVFVFQRHFQISTISHKKSWNTKQIIIIKSYNACTKQWKQSCDCHLQIYKCWENHWLGHSITDVQYIGIAAICKRSSNNTWRNMNSCHNGLCIYWVYILTILFSCTASRRVMEHTVRPHLKTRLHITYLKVQSVISFLLFTNKWNNNAFEKYV